jgi:hypothetical protein
MYFRKAPLFVGEKWIGGGLREQIDSSIKRYVLAKKRNVVAGSKKNPGPSEDEDKTADICQNRMS